MNARTDPMAFPHHAAENPALFNAVEQDSHTSSYEPSVRRLLAKKITSNPANDIPESRHTLLRRLLALFLHTALPNLLAAWPAPRQPII